MSNDQPLIYLDHNATTPVAPEVLDAMLPFLRDQYGNPSSDHPVGQRAAAAVDQARARVADLIGADPADIVFTSGGTESNNLAIRGTVAATAP
ncbi:MAG TPA: aminotransferase class V-fold PLP-dependent enzyme, partial [Dermatophilaceae bacterium]|nr:aminotransferase class V-fold PLP-dependent enzyme [Dermatophilaceae bacterium]